jgi:hypothetical protein
VVLVTDEVEDFRPFEKAGVELQYIAADQIQEWVTGAGGYHNIVKLHVLSEWDQSFIFFDSDIFFSKPVSKIQHLVTPTSCVMQAGGGGPKAPPKAFPHYDEILRICDRHGGCHTPNGYNSGILGVDKDLIPYLKAALSMAIDLRLSGLIKQAEQFADAAVLSQYAHIHVVPNFCVHY